MKKFVESFDVDGWKVETESGEFVSILKTHKTIEYKIWIIELDNGSRIECADNHILIGENNEQIFAKDSHGCNIKTRFGISKVIKVEETDKSESMYDLELDSDKHTYYTNDILSHNTTTSVAYILWLTLFYSSKSCAILANKGRLAIDILERYTDAYEALPNWMQQGVLVWNKSRIKLENGSSVVAASTSSSAIRGGAYNLILLDEFAHVLPSVAEEFINSVYPTVTSGKKSQMIITSTPKGMNMFYKMWTDAANKKSSFKTFEVNWNDVPGRDDQFRERTIADIGEDAFSQEYECNFLGSSDTLISGSKLQQIPVIPIKKRVPIFNEHMLDVYEEPIEAVAGVSEAHLYFMCVDVAEGIGGDYSTIVVFDCSEIPYKIVAKYRSNIVPTIIFPAVVHEVAKYYNEAYVLIEVNMNPQVAENLYYECSYENLLKVSTGIKHPQTLCLNKPKNGYLGIKTSAYTKRQGTSLLKTLIESNKLIINDMDVFQELTTFVRYAASYRADDGYHDDLVMCCVTFAWMTNQKLFKMITRSDIAKRLKFEQLNYIQKEEYEAKSLPVLGGREDEMWVSGGCVWELVNDNYEQPVW